jgi:hypothetical protein
MGLIADFLSGNRGTTDNQANRALGSMGRATTDHGAGARITWTADRNAKTAWRPSKPR